MPCVTLRCSIAARRLQGFRILPLIASWGLNTPKLRKIWKLCGISINLNIWHQISLIKLRSTDDALPRAKWARDSLEKLRVVSTMFAQRSSSSYPKCLGRRRGEWENDFSSIFRELPQSVIMDSCFKGDWTGSHLRQKILQTWCVLKFFGSKVIS